MWAGAALAISAPPQEPFLRGFRRMFSISDCQCHAGMLSQAPAGFCSLYQNPSPSHNSSQPHFPSSRQNLEQVKPSQAGLQWDPCAPSALLSSWGTDVPSNISQDAFTHFVLGQVTRCSTTHLRHFGAQCPKQFLLPFSTSSPVHHRSDWELYSWWCQAHPNL